MTVELNGEIIESIQVDQPLEKVRELQRYYKVAQYSGLPEMIGGLVGYFGYEIVGYIEQRLAFENNPDDIGTPDIMLMVSENVLVFDNLSGRIFMVTIAGLGSSFAAPVLHASDNIVDESDYELHFSQTDFEAAVERCREYIREGDIMQVVLSQRLSTDYTGRAIDLYRALRTINPSLKF